MTERPEIRTMTRADVDFAMGLAADEGWNPGLSDAEAFFAADPKGFFISELNGKPVGTISAVRYPGGFGFVGLYILVPEARGKGWGMALWDHAMRHLDGCTVGLDAVTEQEATYTRSGFASFYRSARYEGVGAGEVPDGLIPLSRIDSSRIAAYDRRCFPADRGEFLRAWLGAPGVTGYGLMRGDRLAGYGVIRPCREGHKIGPLFADDGAAAEVLYRGLSAAVPGGKFYLDVIEPNRAATDLVRRHGLERVFVTVRMYTGPEPDMDKGRVFGVTSFELG